MEKDISKVAVRDALPPRREPYWIRLTTGHSLGFRRMTESSVGTWIARFWEPVQSKKPMKTLGDFSDIPKGERFNAARKAAEEWFTHLGRGGKTGKFTVSDICTEYVEHVRDTKGEIAARDVARRFESYVLDDQAFAVCELTKLTPQTIGAWKKRLSEKPVSAGKNRGGLRSESTLNRDMTCFRAALNYGVTQGYLTNDFAWKEKLKPKANADQRRTLYLTEKQRGLLIKAAEPEIRDFLEGLCRLPLRPQALAKLKVSDFDQNLLVLHLDIDKSHARRSFTFPERTATLLLRNCQGKRGDEPIFQRANGHHWNKDAWKGPVKEAVLAAGLPENAVTYSLRHSTITDLVQGNVDLLTVAQLAGTSLRMIEMHYGHFRPERGRQALAHLNVET